MKKLFLFLCFSINISSSDVIRRLQSEIATMNTKIVKLDSRIDKLAPEMAALLQKNEIFAKIEVLRKHEKFKEEKINELVYQITSLASWIAILTDFTLTSVELKKILDNFIKHYVPNITSIEILTIPFDCSDKEEIVRIEMLLKKLIVREINIDGKNIQEYVSELGLKRAQLQNLTSCVIL